MMPWKKSPESEAETVVCPVTVSAGTAKEAERLDVTPVAGETVEDRAKYAFRLVATCVTPDGDEPNPRFRYR